MKLAVLMDDVSTLKPAKDTTLRILQRAEEFGWEVFVFRLSDMQVEGGVAKAHVSKLSLNKNATPIALTSHATVPLTSFNIILMRKDPPFDMEYIVATYALDLAAKEGVLVANRAQSLRDCNEKFFTQHFPQCCPPTLTSRNMASLRAFHAHHGDVVFKPLEGMGGRSVFRVDKTGANLPVILETLTHGETVTVMAQRYIADIAGSGDQRVLLINGEPVPYALARIPASGDMRGNLAAGARGEVVPISERQREIAAILAPVLREKGLYFVGIDVIGDYLTEINVTSPTCLREIEAFSGLDIAGDYLRCLEKEVLGL
ncbi:glutathione synthetase [Legionella geestiana]|uniref:Glutathione synthetase n=1 Tax=Legionella geestiana TaxID=45065 RepID=A0A0W0TPE3_9GAMM|nr:glutathione synthase [Legionella geestiana]KTC97402.1 glutathione synthetase [Legionella geestiana]QBS11415.1 glutathione synthase [Legionella geestiana]QDQ38972.1 glutathione synthase [Legionella geestiana]STX53926.1 glutathione synthetase [Legionella geestiana]